MLVDTGPLIALFDRNDPFHAAATKALGSTTSLVTTWPVLTEACHILPRHLAIALLQWAQAGGLSVHELGDDGFRRVAALFQRYRDVPMDFADASLIALAELTGLRDIATIDFNEFETYRTGAGTALQNVMQRR